jgi:anti-anti-sigma regulatory factor
VFVLSGALDRDHAARLDELISAEEPDRVRLDLGEVTVVDRTGVRFLARAVAAGIALVNCPDYIRRWIATEEES